ncbi:MAG: hypothetical protein IKN70_11330 [Fibrobacter sp.]|nr:hypothetical protein [Fibrobacter sp.]
MKTTLKLLSISVVAAGMMTLSGCGDDSPTHIEFDENFEMVLSKASYYYHPKDSLLVITPPECKASTLGYVVWNKEGEEPDSMKAYRNGDIASIRPLREYEWSKYEYNGKSFPAGIWYEPKAVDQNIMNAKRFLKSGVVEEVFRYEGKCFASSLLHQLMKKNQSIVQADSALAKFYVMFQPEGEKHFDAKEMLDDLRAPKCNKLTMYSGDVSIGMNNFTKNSGTVTLGFGKQTCNIKFKLRSAYDKADCEAAFGDFKDDKNAERTFNFDNYSEWVDYDIYCIKRLVLNMQEEKKILPRKQAGENDDAVADELARSAVRAVLSGMRAE